MGAVYPRVLWGVFGFQLEVLWGMAQVAAHRVKVEFLTISTSFQRVVAVYLTIAASGITPHEAWLHPHPRTTLRTRGCRPAVDFYIEVLVRVPGDESVRQ